MSAAPEDELLLMREIFMHNITTGKFLNIFFLILQNFIEIFQPQKIYKYFNSYRDIFFSIYARKRIKIIQLIPLYT